MKAGERSRGRDGAGAVLHAGRSVWPRDVLRAGHRGSHSALWGCRALPLALTFASFLRRAPGICQAPERELPGCRRVSAPRWVPAHGRGRVCSGQLSSTSCWFCLAIVKLLRLTAEPGKHSSIPRQCHLTKPGQAPQRQSQNLRGSERRAALSPSCTGALTTKFFIKRFCIPLCKAGGKKGCKMCSALCAECWVTQSGAAIHPATARARACVCV